MKKRMSNHGRPTSGSRSRRPPGVRAAARRVRTPLSTQISTAGIFGQNPNDFINSDGRLVGDRPVVLKTQFLYQLPWGIMSSVNFQSQSGKPIYSEIRATTSATGIPERPESSPWRATARTARNTGRRSTPASRSHFKLGAGAEVAVFGDFLNLFNSDANESVLDRRLGNSNYLSAVALHPAASADGRRQVPVLSHDSYCPGRRYARPRAVICTAEIAIALRRGQRRRLGVDRDRLGRADR